MKIGMKKGFEAKAFLLVFLFLAAALGMTGFWHAQKFFPPVFVGASLDSFDKQVSEGQEVCFSYTAYPGNVDVEKQIEASAIVNDSVVYKNAFPISKSPVSNTACFPSSFLSKGSNRVDVLVNNRELFFNVEKLDFVENPEPELSLLEVSDKAVLFSVRQKNIARIEPVDFFVNGKLQKRLFAAKEFEEYSVIPQNLSAGKNSIAIEFAGQRLGAEIEKNAEFSMNPFLGFIALLGMVFAFCLLVFTKGSFAERMAPALASAFAIIVFLVFLLNYAGLLSPESFVAFFLAIIAAIIFFFRKNFSPLEAPVLSRVSSMQILVFVVFVLLVLFFNVFSYHHLSYWTPYYERQTEAILENSGIPTLDPYSYLGKGYTFLPGYFLLEAGISWLTGLQKEQLFGIAIALSNLFFLLSLFALGKAYGFGQKKNALLYAFLCLSSFILTFFVVSPRHTFSFGFFILAVALLFQKKPLLSGVFLAVAGFMQAPLLAAFPFFYVFYSKKVEWKDLLKAFAAACAVFAVLFLPNLLLYGMPSQAQSSDWGYLIKVDALRILSDIGAMAAFFLLFLVVDFVKERQRLGWPAKKLAIAFVIGVLIQVFITYRWNIFGALGLAILLVMIFPEKVFSSEHAERLLAILFLVAFWFVFIAMFSMTTSDLALQPMGFLETHSANNDVILTDPLFGHSITYFVHAKVVADLAVEYVDPQKLKDSYSFLKEKDYSLLEKYGAKFVVNQGDLINENATLNKPLKEPLEFDELDKVYSDEFIFIHLNTRKS